MRIDDRIRRLGFQRWHERRLIEGHVYIAASLVTLLALLIAIEVLEFRKSVAGFLALGSLVFAGGLFCIFAFRQYIRLVFGAERLAEQAHCPKCKAYAKFLLLHAADSADALEGRAMTVRCRVCSTDWKMG
jgi:hypothetical protein